MHFSTTLSQTFTFILLALPLVTFSYPVNFTHVLEARATCGDGGPSPCICNNALALRLGTLPCDPLLGFHFVNEKDPKDGTVKEVTGATASVGKVQCDHVVELQFIAAEIAKKPGICTHFTANPADFRTFFNTINGKDNLVFVEGTVNLAKGIAFGGGQFDATTVKAASGVVSYLSLLKKRTSAPFVGGAQAIGDRLNGLVGAANGITGFQAAYTAKVNSVIASVETQVKSDKLLPAPAPGDPFVDQTAATIARCQRKRTMWEEVKALVVRATTGKKTPPPATSCALPAKSTKATKTSTGKATGKTTPKSTGKITPKKTSKTTAKKSSKTAAKKTAAKTTAKASVKKATPKKTAAKTPVAKATPKKTTAKTPVAKKATPKKTTAKTPVAKKATPKKTAAKRPVAKKTVSKRPAAKRPAAKRPAAKRPAAKKTVAKKVPVKRPVVKKPVRKGRS